MTVRWYDVLTELVVFGITIACSAWSVPFTSLVSLQRLFNLHHFIFFFLRKGSLTQLNFWHDKGRKLIRVSVHNVPFSVISLLFNPDLWCPYLYWSHFLHDSTFLFDTPCLGKGSIIHPHPGRHSCQTSSEPSLFPLLGVGHSAMFASFSIYFLIGSGKTIEVSKDLVSRWIGKAQKR